MKTNRMNPLLRSHLKFGMPLVGIILISLGISPAANIYWDGTGTLWSSVGSWDTNVGGTGGNPGTVPSSTTSDTAYFSTSPITNTAQTVNLDAPQSATGLVFLGTNTATTTLQSVNTTTRVLTLGTSGILVDSLAGAVTLGSTTNAVTITLVGAQSWTNNSANLLTETNAITNAGFLLTIAGTGNTTIKGALGGTGGLTKIDSGTLTLSGTNTFTGPLTVEQGILQVATVNDASANGVFGNSATAVILGKTGGITGTLEYTGATASSTKKFTMATGGTGAFQVDTSGTVLTLSGVIDGGGALTKTGAGTLVLSGTNTFSGQLIVEQGILQVAAVNNASANGVLGNSASSVILGKTGGITGTLAYTGGGTTTSSTKKFTLATGGTGTFQVDTSSTVLTLSGEINGGGALTKTNSGTLVLTGSNTYTGATTISAGLLKLGVAGDATNTPLGTADAGTIVSATNAALDLNGFTLGTAEALTLNGTGISSGGALTNSSATAATYSGLLTLGSTSSIVASSGNLVLSNEGTISGAGFGLTLGGTATGSSLASIIGTGAGTLTKTGAGTWTLSGASTYTGLTTISVGTLKLGAGTSGSNTPLGTAATGTSVTSGATLDLNGNSITTAEALTLNGIGVGDVGALTNSSATAATYAGLITLGVASRIGGNSGDIILTNTGTITGGFDFRLEGSATGSSLASIIGIGVGDLFKSGTGTWTLTGVNTYTGITRIEGGTLKLGAAGNGTNSPLGTVAGATGTQIGGALDLNGISLSTAEALTLRGTGVNSGGALTNTSATSATYKGDITMVADVSIVASGGNIILSSATDIVGSSVNLTVGGTKNTRIESNYAPNTGSTLTKEGTGTLTLTAANSYAGATTVSAGVLNIQNALALGLASQSGTSVTAGAALQIEKNLVDIMVTTETLTLNGGGISNDGALRNISGNNVWQAPVTLGSAARINSDAGTLTFNTAANSITGTNQNLTLGGAGSGTVSGTITTGTGTLTKDGAGTWTLSGVNTYTGLTTVSQGTLAYGVTNALSNGAVTVNGGTLDIKNFNDTVGAVTLTTGSITGTTGVLTGTSYVFDGTGSAAAILAGTGAVTKSGAATTTTLSGVNTFTGVITLTSGTLSVGTIGNGNVAGNLGKATNVATNLVFNGGTLQYTGATDSTDRNFTLNAGTTGTFDVTTNNLTISGASTATTGGLTKTGSGTLTLSGNNLHTGTTTVSQGTLSLGRATSTLSDSGAVTVSGGTLDVTNSDIVGAVTLSSGTISGAGTLTGSSYALTGSGSVSAILGGTGALTKSGAGTAILSGANSYSGKTVVGNGSLSFSVGNATATSNQSLGTNTAVDLGVASTSSGTLVYTGAAGTLAKAINALGNGSDTIQNAGSGLLTLSGTLTKTGTILTLKGGSYGITVTGAITGNTGSPNSDLIIDGGITTLANANSYEGPTFIINGATLNANVTNALPTANGRSALSMDQTGSGTSTLTLGADQSIASLTGASTSVVTLGAHTLTIGSTTGSTTFAGVIGGSGGGLTKDGASTQVLSGANTYTGLTTVSAGTLVINGDQSAAAGAVSVTGKLAGSGTVGGATTINTGGTHAPGAVGAVGTQLFKGALHYATGSIFEWDLNATDINNSLGMVYDMVGADGAITVDTTSTTFKIIFGDKINMSDAFWSAPYVTHTWAMSSIFGKAFTIGTGTSIFSTVNYPENPSGSFAINGTNLVYSSYSSVPEPTTALAGLLLGAGLLRRRRA